MDKQKIRDKLCEILGLSPKYLPKEIQSDEWSKELIEFINAIEGKIHVNHVKTDFDPLDFIS